LFLLKKKWMNLIKLSCRERAKIQAVKQNECFE
jgi:hypothetical protein